MTSGFRQYFTEYTVANFLQYPIRQCGCIRIWYYLQMVRAAKFFFGVQIVYTNSEGSLWLWLALALETLCEKTCLMPYANNKGADQSAHQRSLISTFVVRCLYSIKPTFSKSKISRLKLASVPEQAGLSLIWSQIPEYRSSRNNLLWHDTAILIAILFFITWWWGFISW